MRILASRVDRRLPALRWEGIAIGLFAALAFLSGPSILQHDRAFANKVTLKCTFSLWNDLIDTKEKALRGSAKKVMARTRSAPARRHEVTRVIDFTERYFYSYKKERGYRSGSEIHSASANEIALKCSFPLNEVVVSWVCCNPKDKAKKTLETKALLAKTPVQHWEDVEVIDIGMPRYFLNNGQKVPATDKALLGAPGQRYRVDPDQIRVERWHEDTRMRLIFPGQDMRAGIYWRSTLTISRLDLTAEGVFGVRVGSDSDDPLDRKDVTLLAYVALKGTCTRVPRML